MLTRLRCLAREGFRNQICIDFSPIVLKLMAAKAEDGVIWRYGDVRDLVDIADGSIDVAFDKATLDSMIYGSPWNPPDDVKDNTSRYISEVSKLYYTTVYVTTNAAKVYRVLKADGIFLCVTFRQPHFVKPIVNHYAMWDVEIEVLREEESAFEYYGLVMTKTCHSSLRD